MAFSFPEIYTCSGSLDYSPAFCCELCCNFPGEACNRGAHVGGVRGANPFVETKKVGDSCNKRCNVGPNCSGKYVLPKALTVPFGGAAAGGGGGEQDDQEVFV